MIFSCKKWYNNLTKHDEIKDFYISENIVTSIWTDAFKNKCVFLFVLTPINEKSFTERSAEYGYSGGECFKDEKKASLRQ